MKDFNLLQIIPELNSGGAEQATIDVAKSIGSLGNKSIIVSNGGRMVPLLKKHNIKHYKIPVHSKNILTIFLNIFKLRKIIKIHNINIVHVRSRAPAWSALFCKSKKIKLVSTFHNIYGNENFFKKKYNKGLSKSDKIIAISQYVKKSIIKIYDIDSKNITVIPRGIDVDYFDSNNIKNDQIIKFMEHNLIPLDKKIILFPGRLTQWKGQIEFLNILKDIKNKNIFCLFVGDDKNKKYALKLKNAIIKNNLSHLCRILGNQENMPLVYKLSHLVISAPLKGEGFGRIIAESMAMQKIIIAYDYGGATEQIKDLEEINRVTPLDQEDLLKKILKIVNINRKESNNLVNLERDIVLKKFTKKQMIDKTIKLYNSL